MKLLLLALFALLVACAPFDPGAPQDLPAGFPGGVNLGPGYLQRRQCVEARGHWDGSIFRATRFVAKDADDEVVLRGEVVAVTPLSHVIVGGAHLALEAESRFFDAEGAVLQPENLSVGAWVKAECIERADGLALRKLSVRNRPEGALDEIQGTITLADRKRHRLEIGGLPVRFDARAPVGWAVKDTAVPAPDVSAREFSADNNSGLARVRQLDDDDLAFADQHRVTDWLRFAGEVQYDMEWRGNHDLQDWQKRDRLIHELSATLELSMQFSRKVSAFTKLHLSSADVLFDQDNNIDLGQSVRVDESFVLLEDLIAPGVSLQVGRQDFDDGREWLMDDTLDAARLWLNLDESVFEASVSRKEFTSDPQHDGVDNWLLAWHGQPLRGTTATLYHMERQRDTAITMDRAWTGFTAEFSDSDWVLWGDGALLRGEEGLNRLHSWGLDFAAMWAPSGVAWRPSLYAGWAKGSGASFPAQNFQDGTFRQSGLNDNNDRFNGITSFRYLGELMQPELANMQVLTLGAGVRLDSDFSLDVVYHQYSQSVPMAHLFDTRLRLTPQGIDVRLGSEVDLILGVDCIPGVEMELVLAWFDPGRAFASNADDAWFMTLKLEHRF